MNLPHAVDQAPLCGSCGLVTKWVWDQYECGSCGLGYGEGHDATATYLDADAGPCGCPCNNPKHLVGFPIRFECSPCALPASHTTPFHWSPCQPVRSPR